jgi:hypothetical protein
MPKQPGGFEPLGVGGGVDQLVAVGVGGIGAGHVAVDVENVEQTLAVLCVVGGELLQVPGHEIHVAVGQAVGGVVPILIVLDAGAVPAGLQIHAREEQILPDGRNGAGDRGGGVGGLYGLRIAEALAGHLVVGGGIGMDALVDAAPPDGLVVHLPDGNAILGSGAEDADDVLDPLGHVGFIGSHVGVFGVIGEDGGAGDRHPVAAIGVAVGIRFLLRAVLLDAVAAGLVGEVAGHPAEQRDGADAAGAVDLIRRMKAVEGGVVESDRIEGRHDGRAGLGGDLEVPVGAGVALVELPVVLRSRVPAPAGDGDAQGSDGAGLIEAVAIDAVDVGTDRMAAGGGIHGQVRPHRGGVGTEARRAWIARRGLRRKARRFNRGHGRGGVGIAPRRPVLWAIPGRNGRLREEGSEQKSRDKRRKRSGEHERRPVCNFTVITARATGPNGRHGRAAGR